MWVAREENGLLRLYTKLPYRYSLGVWRIPNDGDCVTISDEDYPQFKDLKWEDEPIEVDIMPSDFRKKLLIDIKSNIRSGKYDGDLWKLFDDLLEICG